MRKKKTPEEKKIARIRNRITYERYCELLHQIEKGSPEDILELIFFIQDTCRSFKYKRNSMWAYESLKQVIQDRKNNLIP